MLRCVVYCVYNKERKLIKMLTHPYKVTVVDMRGNVTQEIVWAVDEKDAKEKVQMELPETMNVYKIGVDFPTKRELDELERI